MREVQEAAARYARLTPKAIEEVAHAGRGAALLPGLRFLYRDMTTDANRDSTSASGSTSSSALANTGTGWEVALEWRLDQLASNPARLEGQREAARLEERRASLLSMVDAIYFQRRHDLLDLADLEGKERSAKQIDVDQLTADLDALTGGWFSRRLEGKERR